MYKTIGNFIETYNYIFKMVQYYKYIILHHCFNYLYRIGNFYYKGRQPSIAIYFASFVSGIASFLGIESLSVPSSNLALISSCFTSSPT